MKARAAALLVLLPTRAAAAPLGYLSGSGFVANRIAPLAWGLIGISVAVCLVIAVLLMVAIFRRRGAGADVQPVDDRLPIRWITIGVAISTGFLVVAAIWTLVTVDAIGQPRDPAGFSIDIAAQQWWWQVNYDAADPSRSFVTANELVLPVGVPVRINLTSKDVIHSFWVPKLGGKMDVIPSRTNTTWLQGDAIGEYHGVCAEFCGLQHAHMALDVRVVSAADFETWWNHQLEPAAAPPHDPGLRAFMVRCAACHSIRGTEAGGILGPDLTHFGSRASIAAGLMPNTTNNLDRWINNTQTLKPGVKMPELHMLAGETRDVTRYLEGLK